MRPKNFFQSHENFHPRRKCRAFIVAAASIPYIFHKKSVISLLKKIIKKKETDLAAL